MSLATDFGKTLALTNASLDFDLALSLGSAIAFSFNGLGGMLQTGMPYTLINANNLSGFNASHLTTNFLGALRGRYAAPYSTNGSADLRVTFTMFLGGSGMLLGCRRSRRGSDAELSMKCKRHCPKRSLRSWRSGRAAGRRPERGGSLQEAGSKSEDLPSLAARIRWSEGEDRAAAQGTEKENGRLKSWS